jgi:hypothetical protein
VNLNTAAMKLLVLAVQLGAVAFGILVGLLFYGAVS